ncbi:hypothetical protein ACFX10_017934 [Malus domestica]
MSNFATTEYHHHGRHGDHCGNEEWANSMAVGPSGHDPKSASPGGSPACCHFSSPGPAHVRFCGPVHTGDPTRPVFMV